MSKVPLFSVIILTCHRNDLLAKCLNCLAPGVQTLPAEQYEVIVTDDGSKTTAEQMIRESYPWVKWVEGPRKGIPANRNNGAKYAIGEWLAFVDDDCQPDKDWLNAFATVLNNHPVDLIEGRTSVPDKVDNPFTWAPENEKGGNFWGCNLALKREVFCQLSGFDEDLLWEYEDVEFAYRIQANKFRTYFAPEALVIHPIRKTTLPMLIRNTATQRWKLLYLLKTGQSLPLSSNPIIVLINLTINKGIELLQITWSTITKFQPQIWRTMLLRLLWKWLTFPITVPYLMYWEIRFRQQLNEKQRATVS